MIEAKEYSKFFNFFEEKIERAIKENRPIDDYVNKQIQLLMEAHDNFIISAKRKGYDVEHDVRVGEIEVKQYAAMLQIAKKWGMPTERYENLIKEVKIRIFGKENYTRFFDD